MKISIIIPTYNRAYHLPITIQSVLDQSYLEWECIIVDDGSTDNTRKIMLEYSKEKKIKYIRKKTGGVASARNRGMYEATENWITYIDDDDIVYKNKFNETIKFLEKNNNVDFLVSHGDYIVQLYEDGEKSKEINHKKTI